jgi:sensor histidine kinase YesM
METTTSNLRIRIFFCLWFLIAGTIQFGLELLHDFPIDIAWKDALLSSFLMILLGQILYLIQHNWHPARPLNFVNFAIIFVFTGLFQLLFNSLFRVFFGTADWLDHILPTEPIRAILAFLSLMLISMFWWIRKNEQTQAKIQHQLLEKERALTKAELDNIHQQLQPHFLFNSLNSIGALTILEPTEAHRMIQLLSNFLRGTLRKDVQQLVPLHEELEQVRLYLEIEKVRFGHRLTTEINYTETCTQMQVPALILQPIIENAIKYGLYGQTNAITIKVDVLCEGKLLTVSVSSPYDPQFVAAGEGKGFGLASIQRRLNLFFGQNGLLTTTKNDERFTTTICIPQV